MNEMPLKRQIIEALWQVVDQRQEIASATLTGSFVDSENLAGLSDIDFVVIVDELNAPLFESLKESFAKAVEPIVNHAGYSFLLNPTLGPLKFNAPNLAVLHLMIYSSRAHVEHVINSPFTCLDWQQSPFYRKQSLSEVYPAFGLQPRHFLSARRSITDYLNDFRESRVSYRELVCDQDGYCETKCGKSMDSRDRHEFSYHVMRFLMLNLLKLIGRYGPRHRELSLLMDDFFEVFPHGRENARWLLMELARKKKAIDYDTSVIDLASRIEQFVADFEQQFRQEFVDGASRHIAFRHAATELNQGALRFVGRSNPPILPAENEAWERMAKSLRDIAPSRAFTSPLVRCRQSLKQVCGFNLATEVDERLIEMDYGKCEALTVAECRQTFPRLFESWQRAEDPKFPDGENSDDVVRRALAFANEHWKSNGPNTLVCTHNVVLRNLVGEALHVPPSERYRIRIPHLAPIQFIATRRFGLFVELETDIERTMFSAFDASNS